MRVAEPGDSEAVADVFLAAKAQMTYPEIHTKAETRPWIRDFVLRGGPVASGRTLEAATSRRQYKTGTSTRARAGRRVHC